MPVVVTRSKRYKKAAEKAITEAVNPDKAVEVLKTFPVTKFDQSVELIFARFKKLLATHELQALGSSGRGLLTISAGLAVYPWQASTMDELIDLADKRLMFGAKKAGKNSIVLVGGEAGTSP